MIPIVDDIYVTVEGNPINYTVRRGSGKTDSKGVNRDKVLGYCTSLEKAILLARRYLVAEKLQGDFSGLLQAVEAISEVDSRLEKILAEVKA